MASRLTRLLIALAATILFTWILILEFRVEIDWSALPFSKAPALTEFSDITSSWKLHPEQHRGRDARKVHLAWNITSGLRRPDGVLKRVYLINDAFPGPTIEARNHDHFVIDVHNFLDNETVSLHWHGLNMRGSNDMDGAAGITQDAIQPGASFTYRFTVQERHGTFWYHAHDGVQRADGLYGGFVVHRTGESWEHLPEPTEYLLMVSDWYHRSAQEALVKYMHPGAFGLETVPDSILVNGKGVYNCSNAVRARPVDCDANTTFNPDAFHLDLTRDALVRVVNVGAYAGISLGWNEAVLTPKYVDGGHEVRGVPTISAGVIHPGERIAFGIKSSSPSDSDITDLTISLDKTPFKYQNLALTPTQQFPFRVSHSTATSSDDEVPPVDNLDVQTLVSYVEQLMATMDFSPVETIVLYAVTQKLAHLDNEPRGFINHTTWRPQSQYLNGLSRNQWNENQFVPEIIVSWPDAQYINLVVNNLDEEGHPFHLHGYSFWVLSTHSSTHNWGSYNPFEDSKPPGGPFAMSQAVKRDTVYIPRRGYAVLRFKADNPGIWMFHCHVLWHQASGMAMAFEVKR